MPAADGIRGRTPICGPTIAEGRRPSPRVLECLDKSFRNAPCVKTVAPFESYTRIPVSESRVGPSAVLLITLMRYLSYSLIGETVPRAPRLPWA